MTLPSPVVDEDVPSGWAGPPPAEGSVEDQAHQYGAGQDSIDHGDAALGAENRVIQGFGGFRLTGE